MNDQNMIKAIEEHPLKIISNAFILFLAFPIIQWCFWSIVYFVTKNDWVLNKFIQSTFVDNILPWYLGILIDFKGSLAIFTLSFLIVWLIYGFLESLKDG